MLTLRQSNEKTKWISPTGRLIALDLSARCEAVPAWLIDKLRVYAANRDWGDTCVDPWEILRRINPHLLWYGGWGTATLANGVEVFLSEAIPHDDGQRSLTEMAKVLKIDMAWSVDTYCHVLAPKGTMR